MISLEDPLSMHSQFESIGNMQDLKSFDLYTHLKMNVKEHQKNCKDNPDNEENFSYYCVPCKISICNSCNFHLHKAHFLIKKMNFELEKETIEKIFQPLELDINNSEIFNNISNIKQELKNVVTNQIDVLHEKLNQVKEMKFKEIDGMFVRNETCIPQLKKSIDDIKVNIVKFFEKNKKFLNYNKFANDNENAIFLTMFEMMNLCIQKNKEISTILTKIKEDYFKYEEVLKNKTETMLKSLEAFFVEENKEDQIQPSTTISTKFDSLLEDFFKDIKLRTSKYNEHIENFKTLTFDFINKTGNLKEIEKIVNLFDKKNERGVAFIFNHEKPEGGSRSKSPKSDIKKNLTSKRQIKSGKKPQSVLELENTNNLNHNNGNETLQTESQNDKNLNHSTHHKEEEEILQNQILNIKNKNDIKLDNRVIQRYFSYATLDTVNKNFRIKTNAGITSYAFLNFKPELDIEEEGDVCKPIIGTNEIHIYDRKKRTLVKKKVNLDKNLYGFTTFLDGMRHVLVGDKLFITGGRDESQEYNCVLTYDIKEFHLKRIGDMKVPHSYHTLEYNELFKTILVIGGQNNKSCEMFDLFTSRWRLLPELNFPRANLNIYFDKNENTIYTLFGIKGDITQKVYSDVIEVLELQDMGKGWVKIDYNNKSELDFKQNYCGVFPISSTKLLVYGANPSRNNTKIFALFLMNKLEMIQVEKKFLEDIRMQARKSAKLSKILSNMSN